MINLRTEFFLAVKYFKPKRNAVSLITLISVLGVALGVAVLIVVWAVMTGFTDMMKKKLLETTAHIHIYRGAPPFYIEDPAWVVDTVKKCGAVAVPVIQQQVLIQNKRQVTAKMLLGLDPENSSKAMIALRKPLYGKFSLEKNEVMISRIVASDLGVGVGDILLLHAPNRLAKMIAVHKDGKVELNKKADVYLPREFKVSGIFSFGKYDFDKNVIFIGLDDADELFGYPWGAATGVFVWTADPFNLGPMLDKLRRRLPNMQIMSWKDMNRQLLGVLTVEKNMMFFLLIFIVLVAAFSITNTLITMVIQKTREIGLLKSLGADSGMVMRVFLLQGLFVGLLGSLCGTVLGVLVVVFRNDIMHLASKVLGIELFPAQFYFFNELPAHIVASDLAVIVAVSIVLCTFGGIIPAWRAARLDAARALRYE